MLDITGIDKIEKAQAERPSHPVQPLYEDNIGIQRFKENTIVRFLLDRGPFDMNVIAALPFPTEDRVQFAQLIGYSLCGFGELSYVTDEDYERAARSHDN